MLLPRIALLKPSALLTAHFAPGRSVLLRVPSAVRHATHKASKAANGGSNTAGKRLGAKKTAGEKVVPGMIIYRQRGTLWFAGENAGMGRDHTIFAMQPGYVRYYRDTGPKKRPTIGVALTRDQKLPRPLNAAHVRRLGCVPVPLVEKPVVSVPQGTPLTAEDWSYVRPGSYIPRPDNWRIGKVMPTLVRKKNVFEGLAKSAERREARLKRVQSKPGKGGKVRAKGLAKARAKKLSS